MPGDSRSVALPSRHLVARLWLFMGVACLSSITAWAAAPSAAQKPEAKPPSARPRAIGLPVNPTTGEGTASQTRASRLREGSELVDQFGHFEAAGERLVFVMAPAGVRLVALENLNLERISRSIAGSPRQLDWLVSGIVTEYRGNRFLLIERAVVTSEARALAR